MTVIIRNKDYPIILDRDESTGLYIVTYGEHVKYGLTRHEAARGIGECVMHSLQCEGLLD